MSLSFEPENRFRVIILRGAIPDGDVLSDGLRRRGFLFRLRRRALRLPSRGWAEMIRKVYEVEPLLCPAAGRALSWLRKVTGELIFPQFPHFECRGTRVAQKRRVLALMKKMLKPGGQVIMIDFQKRDLPVGPPDEMKVAREDVIKQLQAAGFRLEKENTFLPYQYFLVFSTK